MSKRRDTTSSDKGIFQPDSEVGFSEVKRRRFNTLDSQRIGLMRMTSSTSSMQSSISSNQAEEPNITGHPTTTEPIQWDTHAQQSPTPSATLNATTRKIDEITSKIGPLLPPGKVFSIRIGSEQFHLSGASISSDAPSYFTHYFGQQLLQSGGRPTSIKTLFIDRDPATFKDIVLHLQGYHVVPIDGPHYARLFADAQFYGLPKLTRQLLRSDIYVQIGDKHFQISKEVLSAPGNTPNFFSLGFAHFFASPTADALNFGDQNSLRPPAIYSPAVPSRSGDTFAEILRMLQGYEVEVRDESHRDRLLRDARFYNFKAVEQNLLACELSYNLERRVKEIVLKLEDLRQSGISLKADKNSPATFSEPSSTPVSPRSNPTSSSKDALKPCPTGWIVYQRPYVDKESSELVLEISGSEESCIVDLKTMKATFHGETKARIASLFHVIASKMGMPARVPLGLMMVKNGGGVATRPSSPATSGLSADTVSLCIEKASSVELDGVEVEWDLDASSEEENNESSVRSRTLPSIKGSSTGSYDHNWITQKGLWRLRVQKCRGSDRPVIILVAVKLQAITSQRRRNKTRGFLS